VRNGRLQQIQSAADVGIDELLNGMCLDVGLVESGRMQDHFDSSHTPLHKIAVYDRSDLVRERRALDVETDAFIAGGGESPHQRFSQMTRTSRDQSSHGFRQ
jgi:hypothetical protein